MTADSRRGLRATLLDFYERHHRIFWALHSLWALATGALVVVLAHESYGYAVWVLGFLLLTWVSTVFFSRAEPPQRAAAKWRHGILSYVTRVMYQETLFFLLPFYFYSTTLDSPNIVFLVVLALLAVLACLDELFDKLLRRHQWFGLFFFGSVTFAALNFLLPLVFGLRLELATVIAAAAGLIGALPLIDLPKDDSRRRVVASLLLPALAGAGLLLWLRVLVPPVPLRLDSLSFARDVQPDTIELIEPLARQASLFEIGDRLAVVATIFAPRRVSTRVMLHWSRNGQTVKDSREIDIAPHEAGFRVWDAFSPDPGPLLPGTYTVAIHTTAGQLIGRGQLRLVER